MSGYLTLSRNVDEAIVIDGNIEVLVSRIEGDRVRLSIKAPRTIPIIRKELIDKPSDGQQAEQIAAGN